MPKFMNMLRTYTETEKRRRTFTLDTAQDLGKIFFLGQCSSVQHRLQCCACTTLFFKNLFYSLLNFFLADQGRG